MVAPAEQIVAVALDGGAALGQGRVAPGPPLRPSPARGRRARARAVCGRRPKLGAAKPGDGCVHVHDQQVNKPVARPPAILRQPRKAGGPGYRYLSADETSRKAEPPLSLGRREEPVDWPPAISRQTRQAGGPGYRYLSADETSRKAEPPLSLGRRDKPVARPPAISRQARQTGRPPSHYPSLDETSR